jgi:response regulator NasT
VIAEDEAIIRLDLKELLEEEGYEVVGETGRGDEAVELVRTLGPDLAILDIKMPGMDGLSAARHLAGERLAAVLILTAFSQRDLVEQARDAGAMSYIVKPFQKSDLIPAIEVALGRHAEQSSLESEVRDLAERLEARKIIDRAKGILMDRYGKNEQEAWRFLQTQAMNRRTKVHEVAALVVAGELSPDPA